MNVAYLPVSQDKIQEDAHVEEALRACGYPPWSFSKVRRQMEFKGDKRKKKNKKQEASMKRPMIVIPYVEKVSEAIVRIMKKHNVPVAMKPWKTLKDLLVHPKDKQNKEDITECVYKVPCANCDKTYVGETGRKLGVRLHEHKTEVESKTKRTSNLFAINKVHNITVHKNYISHDWTDRQQLRTYVCP